MESATMQGHLKKINSIPKIKTRMSANWPHLHALYFEPPLTLNKLYPALVFFFTARHVWFWLITAAQPCVLFPQSEKE